MGRQTGGVTFVPSLLAYKYIRAPTLTAYGVGAPAISRVVSWVLFLNDDKLR